MEDTGVLHEVRCAMSYCRNTYIKCAEIIIIIIIIIYCCCCYLFIHYSLGLIREFDLLCICIKLLFHYSSLHQAVWGCGANFGQYVTPDLLELIFSCLEHTNRFVREMGYKTLGAIVKCSGKWSSKP